MAYCCSATLPTLFVLVMYCNRQFISY